MSSVSPEVVEYPKQVSQFVALGVNFDKIFSPNIVVFVYENGQKVSDTNLPGTIVSSTRIEFDNLAQLTEGQVWRVQRITALDSEHEFDPFPIWPSE